MAIEEKAKREARLLFFVIDDQTRGIASLVEIAYLAGLFVLRFFRASFFKGFSEISLPSRSAWPAVGRGDDGFHSRFDCIRAAAATRG
jgi:hypothetical protein